MPALMPHDTIDTLKPFSVNADAWYGRVGELKWGEAYF